MVQREPVMNLTSNSKMPCKIDQLSVMPECPRTASRARRCQDRSVTRSLALGVRLVGEQSKIQKIARTTCSTLAEGAGASPVPRRLVRCGSLGDLLVVPNGPGNRGEWRSEEGDCNDSFWLSYPGYRYTEYVYHEEPYSLHCLRWEIGAGIFQETQPK